MTELSNINASFLSGTAAASTYRFSKCWISLFIIALVFPFPPLSHFFLFFLASIYFYVAIYLYLFWNAFQGLHQLLNTVGYLIVALWVISQLTKNGRIPPRPSVCQEHKQQTTAGKNMATHWGGSILQLKKKYLTSMLIFERHNPVPFILIQNTASLYHVYVCFLPIPLRKKHFKIKYFRF